MRYRATASARMSASHGFRAFALVVAVALGAGESAVLFHLATVAHVAAVVDGHVVYLGADADAHSRPASAIDVSPRGVSSAQAPSNAPIALGAFHRHALQFSSERYDVPALICLLALERSSLAPTLWQDFGFAPGIHLYRLAPKQSPPA